MNLFYRTLVLLALATPLTVFALPASAPDEPVANAEPAEDTSINHSKILSDQLNAAQGVDTSRIAAGGRCIDITFQSSNPDWNYKFNGDWGLGAGKVGSLGTKTLCGSGAMFFGSQTTSTGLGAASGGNTKLECTVNGSPNNVCNISVVDGYSLSMHCTGSGFGDIGGTRNLFDLGRCPKVNNNGHTCVNTGGHSDSAAQFFKNGGRYWYQDHTWVATNFVGTPKVHCAIHP